MQPNRLRLWGVAIAVFVALVLAGCSGVADKGTGGNGNLTKGEQYEEIEPFLSMMLESSSLQYGGVFWDGVTSEDVQTTPLPLPGLGKLRAPSADSVSVSYNALKGWWYVFANVSEESDSFGTIFMNINDSVRFEAEDGSAQIQPSESTYRVIHGGNILLNWVYDDSESSLQFGISIGVGAEVEGLNGAIATASGRTLAAISVDVDGPDGSGSLDFNVDAVSSNVQMMTADGDNACPYDGTMAMDMSLDMDIYDNNTHVEESSDWNIDVEFVGGGNANVTVVSDDFSLETTEQVCSPPL